MLGARELGTEGPVQCPSPVYDLNATVVSMILTGLGGFSTPAGHIGSEIEVGHDISMLVPEIWCRLSPRRAIARTAHPGRATGEAPAISNTRIGPSWLAGSAIESRVDF